jgi:polyisoprenyl-teichoic acid--peptidoglycan teichoic acid transferase
MAGRRARTRRSWPQRLLITFNVGVIAASLVTAGALAYLNEKLDEVQRVDLGTILDEGSTEPGSPENYLLVGTDSAVGISEEDSITEGRENLGTNSDTIMLLRVEPGSVGAQLLSFPRDLWVTIPGVGEQRINAAISAGGPETLIQTIQDNFGIPVHHYVEVDWAGFQGLVRAVDGVPMYFDKPLRDDSTGLNIPNAGCVTLDADQALAFSRSRSLEYYEDGSWHVDGTGDLGRISRQQAFIRQAIQRAIDKGIRNPITLNSLVNVGIDTVTAVDTELTPDDLIDLGTAFRSFAPEDLRTMTLDVYDDNINGASILRMQDTEANQERLDLFKGLAEGEGGEAGSVRVAINNGTGLPGQADEVAQAFATLGFDTSAGTGDAERFDFGHTVVRYAPGHEAIARFVAAQVQGGADLQEVGSTYVADVIVVTGADYAGLTPELQPPPTPLGGDPEPPTTDPTATTAPVDPTSATTTTQYGIVPAAPPEGGGCS